MITVLGYVAGIAYAAAVSPTDGLIQCPPAVQAILDTLDHVALSTTGPDVPYTPTDVHAVLAALTEHTRVVEITGDVPVDERTTIPDGAVA